eukprot:1596645-Lingulodinium_polyedra.AAC.1
MEGAARHPCALFKGRRGGLYAAPPGSYVATHRLLKTRKQKPGGRPEAAATSANLSQDPLPNKDEH